MLLGVLVERSGSLLKWSLRVRGVAVEDVDLEVLVSDLLLWPSLVKKGEDIPAGLPAR